VVIHALTSMMLLAYLSALTDRRWAALLVTLLFALHPVNTEAVNIVTARNNMLATLFALICMHGYTRFRTGRGWRWLLAAVAGFALSMMSKEYGIMLLPILFVYNRIFHRRKDQPWWHEAITYLPFIALAMVYLWARAQVTGTISTPAAGVVPMGVRLAHVPFLFLYNLRLVFLPLGLHSFIVGYPDTMWSIEALGGGIGLVLILALVWRYRHERLVVFGICAWSLGLFPTLHVIPTSAVSLVSLRWVYFPFAFLCPLLLAVVSGFTIRSHAIARALAAVLLLQLATTTFLLNRDLWKSRLRFFESEVKEYNNLFYAGGYAEVLRERGNMKQAEMYYRMAMTRQPGHYEHAINYAGLLAQQGRPEQALALLDNIHPDNLMRKWRGGWYNNRGMALVRVGRVEEAIASLERAAALGPQETEFLINLGSVLGMSGEYERAETVLRRAWDIDPHSLLVIQNLVVTLILQEKYEEADRLLETVPPQALAGNAVLLNARKRLQQRPPATKDRP
jgi:Flp pilus assembly protein TadD